MQYTVIIESNSNINDLNERIYCESCNIDATHIGTCIKYVGTLNDLGSYFRACKFEPDNIGRILQDANPIT